VARMMEDSFGAGDGMSICDSRDEGEKDKGGEGRGRGKKRGKCCDERCASGLEVCAVEKKMCLCLRRGVAVSA
jgi:hypothetical protein